MRNTRVREIMEIAKNDPAGMSKASYRQSKKDYSDGLMRLSNPKSRRSRRQNRMRSKSGFPKGSTIVWSTQRRRQSDKIKFKVLLAK